MLLLELKIQESSVTEIHPLETTDSSTMLRDIVIHPVTGVIKCTAKVPLIEVFSVKFQTKI